LQHYRSDLLALYAGTAPSARWAGVFAALAPCVARYALPSVLLLELLDAFEQDTRNLAYPDRQALLAYCRLSANPIGRLLLHLYGIGDELSLRQSDAICSALQLINFWQDLSVDGPRRRHYVPDTDLQAHGLSRQSLVTCTDSPAARQLVSELCKWAEDLMREGAPLALRVPGRAGWELRLVVQGGLRILEKIRSMDHAALIARPALTGLDGPLLLWRAARMSQARA
jgi:squalene synthase HpnC